jgi:ATP-binding cassette, subfamily C (CFTR/MRP), member 1
MGNEGEIVDSGTYKQIASRHPNIFQHQNPSYTTLSEAETEVEREPNLGEYQTQLDTNLDDLQRQKGDWRSYLFYIGSMGWLNFFLFFFGSCLFVLFNAIFQVWLTWWTEDTTGKHSLAYWLGLYATWALLLSLALLATPL